MGTKEISDLPLAAFLSVIGYQIQSIKPSGKKSIFVFEESGELEKSVLDYFNRIGKVEPLSFAETIRNLKALTLQG